MKPQTRGNELLTFINKSPTAFHGVENIQRSLESGGFEPLKEEDPWNLERGKSYYLIRNGSSLIAFRMGRKAPVETGIRIIGAHTDSPGLKIKQGTEDLSKGYRRISVEAYGGPILSTWLDRDLSLAGSVMVRSGETWEQRLVDLKRPVAVIPNLAIHLNRDVNKGFEYNKQTHLPAILSLKGDGGKEKNGKENEKPRALEELIADELGIKQEKMGEYDLFFYSTEKGTITGINGELISSGRLDNLAMCHAITTGLLESKPGDSTSVGVFFDAEEVGSLTRQGANSTFLPDLISRILLATGDSGEDIFRAKAKSFIISADGAHALHPSYPEKHDERTSPVLNGGPVIKMSSNYRYATTAREAAFFKDLCKKVGVPCQNLINRSDIPSGTTIGPITSSMIGIRAVDVGTPMLAMHSIRETAGILDHNWMIEVMKEFYK
jgi:aspartyl aminopeptidase